MIESSDFALSGSEPSNLSASFFDRLERALQDEPAALDDEVRRIGRFEVVEKLGEGGFGIVYRVFDPIARIQRAMKVPSPRTLQSEAGMRRFVDEGRKFARVQHPNVARMLEVDDTWGIPYIVLELCPEGSLTKWLANPDRPKITSDWTAMMVARIADGVEAIHDAGLRHRDLKPGNILLVRAGDDAADGLPCFRPLVTDFGIAKFVEDSLTGDHTASGALLGTRWAMSPEAASAKPIDREGDIYGLGVILYTMLTGQRLHQGLTDLEITDRLRSRTQSPSPKAIRDDLDARIVAICERALKKDPRDRYHSASAMALDLRSYLEGQAPAPIPALEMVASVARRRGREVAAGLLAVVAIVAMIVGVNWYLRDRAETWLGRFRSAAIEDLPKLLDARPFAVPNSRLREMTRSPDEVQKLSGSIALADVDESHARYVVDRLLNTPTEKIASLCRAMHGRVPGLIGTLRTAMRDGQGTESSRANAALALVHLGRGSDGFSLFRESHDPGARAYLVHRLGPSGVRADAIIRTLADPSGEGATRRGLLLSLGEVPASGWQPADRDRAEALALNLYRVDSDSGVHGSARWLLKSLGRGAMLSEIDGELSSLPVPPGQSWRVGPSLLTFVRVDLGGRVIEVADTELTIKQARLLDVLPPKYRGLEGTDDLPASGLNYLLSAQLSNAISRDEDIPANQFCYRPGVAIPWEPVADVVSRSGMRMPTDKEFPVYVRAGTGCDRPYGNAFELADRYVQTVGRGPLRHFPVAISKPNDLGLFDTLGGVTEVGQWTGPGGNSENQSALLGGDLLQHAPDLSALTVGGPHTVRFALPLTLRYGLRIVRTLEVRDPDHPNNP